MRIPTSNTVTKAGSPTRPATMRLAFDHFRTASRYADKASQAMVAEMLWQGRGVPIDRPMAYAWADLAAERDYAQFVRLREQYWRAPGRQTSRERAIHQGQSLLPEYGDADGPAAHGQRSWSRRRKRASRSGVSVGKPHEVRVPGPGGQHDEHSRSSFLCAQISGIRCNTRPGRTRSGTRSARRARSTWAMSSRSHRRRNDRAAGAAIELAAWPSSISIIRR